MLLINVAAGALQCLRIVNLVISECQDVRLEDSGGFFLRGAKQQ